MLCLHEVGHEVDKAAWVKSDHLIKDGIIMETEKMPQVVGTNEIAHLLGDGTVRISFNQRKWLMIQSYECACPLTHLQVPYYSLQQPRIWMDICNVEIDEIPGAEHREILGDDRFLKILLDCVTQPIATSEVTASG